MGKSSGRYIVCDATKPVSCAKGLFRPNPNTPIRQHGTRVIENPLKVEEGDVYSARLIVGFNVGDTPTWNIDDLIKFTTESLAETGHWQGSSYLSQKGIWQSTPAEDGGQIIIIDMEHRSEKKFIDDMVELGDTLRHKMKQYSIVLEVQKNGLVVHKGSGMLQDDITQ